MNKLLTILPISYFFVEAVIISIFLLEISKESLETALPWVLGGFVNLAFLVVLLFGIFSKK